MKLFGRNKRQIANFPLSGRTQALIEGKKKIKDAKNWIKGGWKRLNGKEMNYCVLGAYGFIGGQDTIHQTPESVGWCLGKAADQILSSKYGRQVNHQNNGTFESLSHVWAFNDSENTTHKDIMKLCDAAIDISVQLDCEASKRNETL